MNVLVLGGTRFVGRHIVEGLVAAGHVVSVFTRGRSVDDLPASVERLHGDRDQGASGLAALAGRSWDACVDVSGYTPTQVRPCVERLAGAVRRYVFVSTVSVYDDSRDVPIRESHALLPGATEEVTEITGETYGPLKVTCERIVGDAFGNRCTILRPQIVAGPHDPTGRHTYWVQRSAQGGAMAAPGDGTDYVQVVDARDVARFTVRAIEQDIAGVFNMAGPRLTWAHFMELLGATDVTWVPTALIREKGLTFAQVPLFIPIGAERSGFMDVSAARALNAGFSMTDPAITISDTRDWLRDHPVPPALTAAQEQELIALARGTRG